MTRNDRLKGLTLVCVAAVGLVLPSEVAAQRRGGGRGPAVRTSVFVARPVYYPRYYSSFYAPYYDPFFWDWRGYGSWQYPGPYYGGYRYDRTGAARLQVTPKETQVFVDGYFVGKADDFDGSLQRLRVEAGEHELEFYLEGFQTAKERVLFRREATIKISHTMQPSGSGQVSERPVPVEPQGQPTQPGAPAGPPDGPRARPADRMPPPPPQGRPDRGARDDFGTLAIRVQPGDAEILIDGERWDGSDNGSRLTVQLSDGSHRVEIRREGYRTYTGTVRVRRGQTETLNVSLAQ